MKSLRFAIVFALISAVAAPAAAQFTQDSYEFVTAVQKEDGAKATQLLQDHPQIINSRDSKGDTALIIAIRNGDPSWVGFLLNKGADATLAGQNGDTPLIAAARAGLDDAVPWLLSKGDRVNATNRSGENALIVATQQRDARMAAELLRAGADPDHADTVAGYSARDYATRDPRARDILKLINDSKPKAAAAASK